MVSAKEELARAEKQLEDLRTKWGMAHERFAAIDTETTGLQAAKARTIQLAIVLFDKGKPNGKRIWFINPGIRIPANATKVNRITNEMVADKPLLRDVGKEIKRIIERYPVIAHNLKYDSEVLCTDFARVNLTLRLKHGFCTMREEFGSPAIQPDTPPWERARKRRWKKLSDLALEYGVAAEGEYHDAYVDALVAGKCFVEMSRRKIAEGELTVERWRRLLAVCEAELSLVKEKASKYSFQQTTPD